MDVPFIEKNVDYKAMYLRMMNAAEDAINILIEAQRECEQMYVDAVDPMKELLGIGPDEEQEIPE